MKESIILLNYSETTEDSLAQRIKEKEKEGWEVSAITSPGYNWTLAILMQREKITT